MSEHPCAPPPPPAPHLQRRELLLLLEQEQRLGQPRLELLRVEHILQLPCICRRERGGEVGERVGVRHVHAPREVGDVLLEQRVQADDVAQRREDLIAQRLDLVA